MRHLRTLTSTVTAILALAACQTPAPGQVAEFTSTPGATLIVDAATEPAAEPAAPGSRVVQIYFDNSVQNPNAMDCRRVYPLTRTVPADVNVATAALQELLTGPTPEEAAAGYLSLFSARTADALINVRVDGDKAYVNLEDIRYTIPNAGTSCGAAQFLAELQATLWDNTGVEQVFFAIEGDPEIFYGWLQIGCDPGLGYCDPAPFAQP